MTKYRILREATKDEVGRARELNRTIGLPDYDPEVPSVIIQYECPECKKWIETIWLHPDALMAFTTICCEALVVFVPGIRSCEETEGKTYDKMTPEEQAQFRGFFHDFFRARPDILARLFWIPRFLNGYAKYKRIFPQSDIGRDEFLALVVTAGLRKYEPPPTTSTFKLGRQTDRVIRLGLESVEDDRVDWKTDKKNLQLIRTMSDDVEGLQFWIRIGVIDPKTLGRKRP